jgi:hypothetical protein
VQLTAAVLRDGLELRFAGVLQDDRAVVLAVRGRSRLQCWYPNTFSILSVRIDGVELRFAGVLQDDRAVVLAVRGRSRLQCWYCETWQDRSCPRPAGVVFGQGP